MLTSVCEPASHTDVRQAVLRVLMRLTYVGEERRQTERLCSRMNHWYYSTYANRFGSVKSTLPDPRKKRWQQRAALSAKIYFTCGQAPVGLF
jgi:hypothetical protein